MAPTLIGYARCSADKQDLAAQKQALLSLAARGVKLQIRPSVHDPHDPMGKLFFTILASFAEFEADLIRIHTREGMAIARAEGKLKGRRPKLSTRQQQELRRMHDTGDYSVSDLAELFSISRPNAVPHTRPASRCDDSHARIRASR